VINIRYVPLSNTFNAFVKRCMDVVGSIVCIILFSPVMLLSAILVKATSKGPLIFAQERVGLHNKPFQMYKFRTMYVQTEEEEQRLDEEERSARHRSRKVLAQDKPGRIPTVI